ncbi:MAG: PAS domain S-box protein [candidate division Zixibacteria bacterium]
MGGLGEYNSSAQNKNTGRISKSRTILIITILVILILEFLVMLILSLVTSLPSIAIAFIDAAFLALLIYPVLKFLTFKPLINNCDRTKKALQEALQTSNSILKTASNLILVLAENGVIRDCNDRCLNILGYSPKQLNNIPISNIIHPEFKIKARKLLRAVIRDEALYNEEMKMVKNDGTVIDVCINSSSLIDKHGRFITAVWIIDDITAPKKIKEDLELTQFSIDKSSDAVYWIGQDGEFVNVNDTACEVLEYTREELLSMTVFDIDPVFQQHVWIPHWLDVKERKSFIIETKHKTKSGKLYPVEVAVNYMEYGGKEYNCAFARDITDRKQSERDLRAANEQLRTSVENMPLAYILWDTDYRVKEWNRSAERVFGYSRDEVMGKQLIDLIIPWEKRPDTEKSFHRLANGYIKGLLINESNIRKDGGRISCKWYNTPLRNKEGEIFSVLSMVEDLTDQLRIQNELKNINEKFKEFTELLPQTVLELDIDGKILYTNRYGLDFIGYSPEDLEDGLNVVKIIVPEEQGKMIKWMARIRKGQRVDSTELTLLKKNGAEADVVVFANPVFDEERIVGIRGIMIDITETKRLQEFASQAQRLEIAGRISGQVAHDFNNLLGPLFAFPDFIKEELSEESKAVHYLDHIQEAAEQMAEINQQLLTLGRRGHYNQAPMDLNKIISLAIESIGSLPEAIRIETSFAPDLKAIMGGSSQIVRLILNLINNAGEAMNNIGNLQIKTENYYADRIWSRFGRVPEGEYVKLTFSDTGHGIPDDVLAQIFDPFFTTKGADSNRGSGLGLSIVHAVVEDHNGYIDVKSEEGNGTTFYLYFPVTDMNIAPESSDRITGGDENIMVVDDDALQRDVTYNLLNKLGYNVVTVESGEKAVEFIKDNPQDLILLDMMMEPGIDGLETFRRISKIIPGQKAVIVSGYSDSDKIDEAADLGISGFVGKPLSLRSLSKAIRYALAGKTVNI